MGEDGLSGGVALGHVAIIARTFVPSTLPIISKCRLTRTFGHGGEDRAVGASPIQAGGS
jgi:hypothetical protein